MPGISASLVLMASVNCACVCAVVQVLRSCKVTMGSLSLGSSGPNAMSARPILLTALRTSGNSSMALWVCFSISIDSGRDTLGRRTICGVSAPSSSMGINSRPIRGMRNRLASTMSVEPIRTYTITERPV